jgi:hypothetical protein
MRPHSWITVGDRRWCRCNSYQVLDRDEWHDVESLIGATWQVYSPTAEWCDDDAGGRA